MPNWKKLVESHHETSSEDYQLVTRQGATAADIETTARKLGIDFPREFRSLYSVFNGVGLCSPDRPEEIEWTFQPLENLPGFAEVARAWFAKTHPEVAKRFFPFIDWGDGDSMGYLTNNKGKVMKGIRWFQHESYEWDEDQDPDEFLELTNHSIQSYLRK